MLTRGGGTYTARQYTEWLRKAGFVDVGIEPVPGRGTHLVFARNPR